MSGNHGWHYTPCQPPKHSGGSGLAVAALAAVAVLVLAGGHAVVGNAVAAVVHVLEIVGLVILCVVIVAVMAGIAVLVLRSRPPREPAARVRVLPPARPARLPRRALRRPPAAIEAPRTVPASVVLGETVNATREPGRRPPWRRKTAA